MTYWTYCYNETECFLHLSQMWFRCFVLQHQNVRHLQGHSMAMRRSAKLTLMDTKAVLFHASATPSLTGWLHRGLLVIRRGTGMWRNASTGSCSRHVEVRPFDLLNLYLLNGLFHPSLLDEGCSRKKIMGVFDGTFILPLPPIRFNYCLGPLPIRSNYLSTPPPT